MRRLLVGLVVVLLAATASPAAAHPHSAIHMDTEEAGSLLCVAAHAGGSHVLQHIRPALGQRLHVVDGHGVGSEWVVAEVASTSVGSEELSLPSDGEGPPSIFVSALATGSLAVEAWTARPFLHLELGSAPVAIACHPVEYNVTPLRQATKPAPTPSAGQLAIRPGVEQWRGLVASYGGWNVDRMLCLMGFESNGNPTAVNPTSGAAGLFQVMPFWWDHYGGDRFDPATNVRVAHLIWQEQGYRAWSPYKRGLCR